MSSEASASSSVVEVSNNLASSVAEKLVSAGIDGSDSVAATAAGLPANADASQKKSYTVANELEVKSDKELMDLLREANKPGNWNKMKHSKLATLLAKRAFIAAAKDGDIQQMSKTSKGVTKAQVLEWMNGSDTFNGYQQIMCGKWSLHSFHNRMGTAMKDSGYKRVGYDGGGGDSRYALPDFMQLDCFRAATEMEATYN
jgi:hypothetical protein